VAVGASIALAASKVAAVAAETQKRETIHYFFDLQDNPLLFCPANARALTRALRRGDVAVVRCTRYPITMFVRFQQRADRLYVSLLESFRANGTVRQRTIASLGACGASSGSSVRQRSAVWQALHAEIGQRGIATAKAQRLMAALQSRVPYPTPEEIGAADLADAAHDAASWERMHGATTELIDCHVRTIEHLKAKVQQLHRDAEREAALAAEAKAKAKRLDNYQSPGTACNVP
jgi:hypothetical protein